MGGLYQRALSIYKKMQPIRPVQGEALSKEEEPEIPPDEREEVLTQINEIIAKNRIEIKPETFSFIPQRSGAFFPILLNALAVLTILLGAFLFSSFFNRREESLVTGPAAIITAEAKLIKALKQESEQQLNQKDREISEIQMKLADISSERDKLKSETEAQILKREQELREALEVELKAERQRLQSEGISSERIEQQLRELEENKSREYSEQLELFKKKTEAELAKKEASITAIVDEYEQSLQQARVERTQLQEELKKQEAELQAQFRAREKELESDRSRIAGELDQIREQRQKEELVFDQIFSSYNRVKVNIRASQYDEALKNLDTLYNYLNQESIASLPAIQRRRSVELFIIASLRRLIENERTSVEQDAASLIASADLLTSISSIVEQADNRFRAGDTTAAQELYLSAIEKIPALETSYAALKEIEESSLEEDRERQAEIIRKLESEITRAEEELKYEKQAGVQASEIESERAATLERLRTFRERFSSFTEYAELSSGISQEELRDLLEAKLLVKEIIDSEQVRSQYPELYDTMERYFKAFGEEQWKDGQYSTIKDMIAVIDSLINRQDKEDFQAVWERYDEQVQQDLFSQFFDTLRALLE